MFHFIPQEILLPNLFLYNCIVHEGIVVHLPSPWAMSNGFGWSLMNQHTKNCLINSFSLLNFKEKWRKECLEFVCVGEKL